MRVSTIKSVSKMNKRASVNHDQDPDGEIENSEKKHRRDPNYDVDTLTEEQQRRAFGNDVRQAPNKIIRSVLY